MRTIHKELAVKHMLLKRFTSGTVLGTAKMLVGGIDVTEGHIRSLRREIAYLEKVLARSNDPS